MSATDLIDKSQIRAVTAVRGLAALSVACYHMTNIDYQIGSIQQRIISGGWLGVEAFFVISGFVIPWSLLVAHYSRDHLGSFLLRRVVRVDPPYLLSIVLSIALAYAAYATPGYHGSRPTYSIGQVLAHLGYINNFMSYDVINRVYWTLGIEFQYYILIGIFHRAVTNCSSVVFTAILAGGVGLNMLVARIGHGIDPKCVITYWVPLFFMGISVASFRWKLLSRGSLLLRLATCAAVGTVSTSATITAVALATALFIAFLPGVSIWPLDWLGKISYSLYLIHAPFGERCMNVAHRFIQSLPLCLALSLTLTLLAAFGFNWLIEEPARRWAKNVRLADGAAKSGRTGAFAGLFLRGRAKTAEVE